MEGMSEIVKNCRKYILLAWQAREKSIWREKKTRGAQGRETRDGEVCFTHACLSLARVSRAPYFMRLLRRLIHCQKLYTKGQPFDFGTESPLEYPLLGSPFLVALLEMADAVHFNRTTCDFYFRCMSLFLVQFFTRLAYLGIVIKIASIN